MNSLRTIHNVPLGISDGMYLRWKDTGCLDRECGIHLAEVVSCARVALNEEGCDISYTGFLAGVARMESLGAKHL